MDIFDLIPFDEEPTVETPSYDKPRYGVDYVEERSLLYDVLHSAWAGLGDAAEIYGRGSGSDTLRGFGEYVQSTEFAKPDEGEAFKTQGSVSEVLSGAARSIPMNAPMLIGGIGGMAVAGPLGAVAGAGGAAAVLGRGLYDKSISDYFEKVPDGTVEDAENYAFQNTAIEVVTELASTGVDIFTAKLGGQLTKQGIKAALSHNIIGSVDDILGQTAKKVGVGTFLGKVMGGSAAGGASEVLAEKLQYDLSNKYDMKPEAPDYFTTFLIGAVAEAPFNVGANMLESKNRNKIYEDLSKGLASDNVEVRKSTADQIFTTMKKASPEAAQVWKDYSELNVDKGPIALTDLVTQDSSWKLNLKKADEAGIINEIVNRPEEILKEQGIPTGATQVFDPRPPELSKFPGEDLPTQEERDLLFEKIQERSKVKKATTSELPPDYIAPYSPYSMSKAMMEVEPDSNTVVQPEPVVPTRLDELKAKAKLTLKEKKELKGLQAEATKIAAAKPPGAFPKIDTKPLDDIKFSDGKELAALAERAKAAEAAGPVVTGTPVSEEKAPAKDVDTSDLIYSKEDLVGIEVEHTGYNPKTKTVGPYKAPAHEVLSNIEEEISLYEDIMKCASGK